MIAESLCVAGDQAFAKELKDNAKAQLEAGPPLWTKEALERARYAITDGLDDIRHPRSKEELIATASALYGQIADFFFRSNNLWCARRKMIPRKLRLADPSFGQDFVTTFESLFSDGSPDRVIALAENLLKPHGLSIVSV